MNLLRISGEIIAHTRSQPSITSVECDIPGTQQTVILRCLGLEDVTIYKTISIEGMLVPHPSNPCLTLCQVKAWAPIYRHEPSEGEARG